jgi:hypothetical protein
MPKEMSIFFLFIYIFNFNFILSIYTLSMQLGLRAYKLKMIGNAWELNLYNDTTRLTVRKKHPNPNLKPNPKPLNFLGFVFFY